MTIGEAVEQGVRQLRQAHTHDPRGCAYFLLRHVLNKSPRQIELTDPDYTLSGDARKRYLSLLERRQRHEPVWYITNEAFFWQDTFYVDERVLIPRPETELLVETALNWAAGQKKKLSVVEVGTGSGAVALSLYRELAKRGQVQDFVATDISAAALEVAKTNAARLGLKNKIKWLAGDALKPVKSKLDLIIGNPPYVPTSTVGGLAYDIHHFEPRVALDGGPDGLAVHRTILAAAPRLLKRGGAMMLEVGHNQGRLAREIARRHFPDDGVSVKKDYDGHDRLLIIKSGS